MQAFILLVSMLLSLLCASGACAQNYPLKTVRIVVPFPPVGAADLLSRTVGQKLSEATGQQFIVDNRPGAGGNIGAELVAAAPPDGYLLLMAPVSSFAVGMAAYSKLNWNLEKSVVPVAMVANVPHMLVVHPSLPARNVKEIVALGKAHPGELNFASQGNGTLSHLEQEMLKQLGGFTANHIPYKGSAPGLSDLIPGNVQLFFDSIPSSAPYVKTGRLRGIGVASSQRSPALPDLPTIGESLKGFEADSWFGLMAPAGTPAGIVAKLSDVVAAASRSPDVIVALRAQGIEPTSSRPQEFAAFVRDQLELHRQLVKDVDLKISE